MVSDRYESVDDIANDNSLRLAYRGLDDERLLEAILGRMMQRQEQDPSRSEDEDYALEDARKFLTRRGGAAIEKHSSQALEVANKALEVMARAFEAQRPVEPPVEQRLERHQSEALTKASQDFRRTRTVPFGAVGVVSLGTVL